MVSSRLDNSGSAFDARWSAVLGAFVFSGTLVSLISARLVPFALLALFLALSADVMRGRVWRPAFGRDGVVGLSFAALLLLALISTLWSEVRWVGVPKVLQAAVFAGGSIVLVHVLARLDRPVIERAANGLCLGYLIGALFLAIEVYSGQAIQVAVYNLLQLPHDLMQPVRHFTWAGDRLTAIDPAHINRNFAVAALLLFPSIVAALGRYSGRKGWAFAAAISFGAVLAVFGSRHESSKAAIVVGFVILALAFGSRVWTARALKAGWVLACLGVVPLALMAHRLDLHNAPWLQNSMQHRVEIWNHTAEEALKAPVLGIGAYMTYVLGPKRNEGTEIAPGEKHHRTLSRHAHNVFLQTWFELGALGAALLMSCGLAALWTIGRMSNRVQPFAFATFAAAATMMGASYGMWQTWYLALFGFCAVASALGARIFGTAGVKE